MIPMIRDRAAYQRFHFENCERAGGCWHDNAPCLILASIKATGTHQSIRMGQRRIVCEGFLSNKQGRERQKKEAAEAERRALVEMHNGGLF